MVTFHRLQLGELHNEDVNGHCFIHDHNNTILVSGVSNVVNDNNQGMNKLFIGQCKYIDVVK